MINDESLALRAKRPGHERGNAYPEPQYLNRIRALGAIETWDCEPNEGPQSEPEEDDPPCFVEPDSLFDGHKFPTLQRGETSRVRAPRTNEPCNNPSNPPDRGSLRAGCDTLTGSPSRGR